MNIKKPLQYFILLFLFVLVLVPVAPGEDKKTSRSEPSTVPTAKNTGVATEERDTFVTTEVDRSSPYVGEQLLFRLKFFYRVGIAKASLDDLSFGGMQVKEIKEATYNTVVNGVRYQVEEVRKLLIPNEAGNITIPGAVLRCEVPTGERQPSADPLLGAYFFDLGLQRTESRILRSRPISLRVRSLPEKGKPASFSGLVGSFTLTTELDKKEIKEGESVTLAMTVTGKGDLSSAPRPAIQGIEQFQAYDDHPVASEKIENDQLVSVKVFKTALVPLKPGDLTIPAVSIGFFDPETGTYRSASMAPPGPGLHVLAGSGQERPVVVAGGEPPAPPQRLQVAGRDILPIDTGIYPLQDETFHLLTLPTVTSLVVPPFLYLGLLVFKRKRAKLAVDCCRAGSKTALKQARVGIKEAEILAQEKDPKLCYAQLSKTLKAYLGNKLHLAGEAKTADELQAAIQQRIDDSSLVEQTAALFQELELKLFTPPNSGAETPHNLVQATQRLIEQMEKVL